MALPAKIKGRPLRQASKIGQKSMKNHMSVGTSFSEAFWEDFGMVLGDVLETFFNACQCIFGFSAFYENIDFVLYFTVFRRCWPSVNKVLLNQKFKKMAIKNHIKNEVDFEMPLERSRGRFSGPSWQ